MKKIVKVKKYKNWRYAEENNQKLTVKQNKDKRNHYLNEAITECHKYIKLRDFNRRRYVKCVSCEDSVTHETCNACHFISCSCWKYRFDPGNIHVGCVRCNAFEKQKHQQGYTIFMIKKYGIEKVDEMIFESKQIHRKLTSQELEEIANTFKELSRDIVYWK